MVFVKAVCLFVLSASFAVGTVAPTPDTELFVPEEAWLPEALENRRFLSVRAEKRLRRDDQRRRTEDRRRDQRLQLSAIFFIFAVFKVLIILLKLRQAQEGQS